MKKKKPLSRLNVFTWFPIRGIALLISVLLITGGNLFLRGKIGGILDLIQTRQPYRMQLIQIAVVLIILLIVNPFAGYLRERLGGMITGELYSRLQEKNLCMTQTAMETQAVGSLTTLYIRDVREIRRYTDRIIQKFIPDILTWTMTILLFFTMSPYLGITAVVAAIIPVAIMNLLSRQVFAGTKEYQEALEQVNQGVISGIGNLETVKASGMERQFAEKDDQLLGCLQVKKKKIAAWESILGAPSLLSAFITQLLIIAVGGILVLQSRFSIGQLFTAITLVDFVVSPVMGLEGTLSAIKKAKVSVGRLNGLLCQPEEALSDGETLSAPIESLEFDKVSFSYPSDPDRMILQSFSQRWEKGKLNLIKGENGAGKSTLLKLAAGIYPVHSGTILLNGIPLGKISLQHLRKKIAVLTQEHIIFSGSIRDNLIQGLPETAAGKMEQACKALGIHDEIMDMPGGYETTLQEDGSPLSGGQKQRLCLARLFMRDADIILLDEPTAAIDAAHKKMLLEWVERVAKDKIVVVITHDTFWEEQENMTVTLARGESK